jgi:hypothetical protein
MPALVAGIHVFLSGEQAKAWMAGASPAMTIRGHRDDIVARQAP